MTSIKHKKNNLELLDLQIFIYLKTEKYDECIQVCDNYSDIDDYALYVQGRVLFILNFIEKAISCYTRLIERNKKLKFVWNSLGILFFKSNRRFASFCFSNSFYGNKNSFDFIYNLACSSYSDLREIEADPKIFGRFDAAKYFNEKNDFRDLEEALKLPDLSEICNPDYML
ncbi:hypothetical protein DMUE_0537 [Dictyocoela muelleri]|nr:hypothetical protein DMUE_0537 [Dictyocoela muelleri]